MRPAVADLVAFGQLFMANPHLPQRLRVGARPLQPDRSTLYGGGAEGYRIDDARGHD